MLVLQELLREFRLGLREAGPGAAIHPVYLRDEDQVRRGGAGEARRDDQADNAVYDPFRGAVEVANCDVDPT